MFFDPLDSAYQKGLKKHQQLCWESGKLVWGWVVSRGEQREKSLVNLLSHCRTTAWMYSWGCIYFLYLKKTVCSEQTPAGVDDCGYVRKMRWKQLRLQWLSSFRFSCMLSSGKGRYARDVSLVYGWPLVCYFWYPIFGAGCVSWFIDYNNIWEQIKCKRPVHEMNVKVLPFALQTSF